MVDDGGEHKLCHVNSPYHFPNWLSISFTDRLAFKLMIFKEAVNYDWRVTI